jgi:ATP-dependent RNA helicase SUPV3L1/SUV3
VALRASLAGDVPRAAPRDEEAWVEAVVSAAHERFTLDASGRIVDGGRALARLTRGASLLCPEVRLVGLDHLGAGARSRVLRRLLAWTRDAIDELLAPLRARELRTLSAAGRGIVYQLEQGLGTAIARDAEGQLAELEGPDRARLEASGVRLGERALWLPALLRRGPLERRAALCAAWFEPRVLPAAPRPGVVSLPVAPGTDPRACAALGYPVFGSRALRADVVERVHRALRPGDGEDAPDDGLLASWMGCPSREVRSITRALGATG